jgi:aryl-alcohol dehydrogenase-like predicted oxidoreductase
MRYRKLGNTGIKVSEIGFGAWGIGGNDSNSVAYGEVDDNESIKALRISNEMGVNFYDTSDLYGSGHSEKIIAKAFKGMRDSVIIASKGGTLPHTGLYMPQDFSKRHLSEALEKSLQRLKTDYIDLYQLHSPKIIEFENNNIIETLQNFKKQGKIREYGVSVRSPDDGIIAIKKFKMPCIQVNFNLLDQRANQNGLFDLAKSTGTSIINRTPLVFGFLSGEISGNGNYSKHDHRSNYPKEQLTVWANSTNLFSFLHKDKTAAQAALRFCLDFVEVSVVIPGMLNVEEVKENLVSSNIPPFSDEEHERIALIYKQHQNEFYNTTLKGTKDKQID